MAGNKFFATREKASHQGPEGIYFSAHVNRYLSLEDAKELVKVLADLLDIHTYFVSSPLPTTEPSAVDLDAVASEEKTAAATSKPEWELVDGKWQVKK